MASTSWTTPKTDWISTDRYNITDFNRQKNNLIYVAEGIRDALGLSENYFQSAIDDMGDDISDYITVWSARRFNAMEFLLREIRVVVGEGWSQHFYYAGSRFLSAEDCNRIESLTLHYKVDYYDGWINGKTKLPFTLGGDRSIRV